LDRLVEAKREEIQGLKRDYGDGDRERALRLPPVKSLVSALTSDPSRPGLIAEVKPASPSKGDIRPDVNPAETAREYEAGGASAVSVLTERTLFKGKLANLQQVQKRVGIPVLRKDCILEPVQLVESRLAGADVVLLIAALLNEKKLHSLVEEA